MTKWFEDAILDQLRTRLEVFQPNYANPILKRVEKDFVENEHLGGN